MTNDPTYADLEIRIFELEDDGYPVKILLAGGRTSRAATWIPTFAHGWIQTIPQTRQERYPGFPRGMAFKTANTCSDGCLPT